MAGEGVQGDTGNPGVLGSTRDEGVVGAGSVGMIGV